MPAPCRFSEEHPNEICLCSACHLSSELFPRRQDGKIVLPGLPASRDSSSLRVECQPTTALTDAQELAQGAFRLSPPVGPNRVPSVPSSPLQATSPITAERAKRPRVRSHTRTNEAGASFGRFNNTTTDGSSGIPESSPESSPLNNRVEPHPRSPNSQSRPRSRSQSYHTTTAAVSNPYPMPADATYPRPAGKSPLDNRTKTSAQESTSSSVSSPPPASTSNLVNNNAATPPLKFCPPFVASDRIALPPSSDAAKEGVTMIPWSARRRKQKYRSGFDSGTGQGKSKTMFRYYGPDNLDGDTKKR